MNRLGYVDSLWLEQLFSGPGGDAVSIGTIAVVASAGLDEVTPVRPAR